MLRLVLSVLTVILIIDTQPACSQSSASVYPIDTEGWVWSRVQEGQIANLNERCGTQELSPTTTGSHWNDPCRVISASFIKRILTQEPWRSAIPYRGLRITGAQIKEPLDLDAANVTVDIELLRSRFEKAVNLRDARFQRLLSMSGTVFEAGINAEAVRIGGNFILSQSAVVRGGELNLGLATIEGLVDMNGSIFEDGINANDVRVGGHFLLSQLAIVRRGSVDLTAAKIKGDLNMTGSTFEASINANSLRVGGNLFMDHSAFAEQPDVVYARVEGSLDIGKAQLPGLNLTGTIINEGLRLGQERQVPTWGKNAVLVLRGTRVKILQDSLDGTSRNVCFSQDAWPAKLDLQGFVYDQLGVAFTDRKEDLRTRDICWYEKWLARDPYFTRQPYRQLAGVLRTLDPDRADDVLYAAREREREEAWKEGDYWRAIGLGLLKVTIGYGIGSELFRVMYWVVGFTILGAVILWFSLAARKRGLLWCLGASLDHLLPIVELNKEFDDFFNDPKRTRLSGWQQVFFSFQALVGYLLGIFVAAAIAGITQAG